MHVNIKFSGDDLELLEIADTMIDGKIIKSRSDAIRTMMRRGVHLDIEPVTNMLELMEKRLTTIEKVQIQTFSINANYLNKTDPDSYDSGMKSAHALFREREEKLKKIQRNDY